MPVVAPCSGGPVKCHSMVALPSGPMEMMSLFGTGVVAMKPARWARDACDTGTSSGSSAISLMM